MDLDFYKKIKDVILPTIEAIGFEFWGMEIIGNNENNHLIRIYIDSKSLCLNDCSNVSSQIRALLNVEKIFFGKYTLEVSSPGLNRRLFCAKHYEKYIGSLVSITLKKPIENKRNFIGTIDKIVDDKIKLLVNNDEILSIDLSNISKANLNY